MKVFKLTLVRHGETAHNRLRLLQGQMETHLTDMGRQQAKLLAKYLDKAAIGFHLVYTSDLIRACETCEIIVRGRRPIFKTALLRERSYGTLQGLPTDVARARLHQADPSDPFSRPQSSPAQTSTTTPTAAYTATASTATTATVMTTTSATGSTGSTGSSSSSSSTSSSCGPEASGGVGWGSMPAPAPAGAAPVTPSRPDERPGGSEGETLEEVRARVMTFCEDILFPNVQHCQRVLVVSHGGAIREFMKLFRDKYSAQIGHADIVITPNTAINDFDILLSTPDNVVQRILPINVHQIPHLTFDVYNRDNPHPSINFQMTTLEQFGYQEQYQQEAESGSPSEQPWGSD